ncbi:MAG: AAA family ATPase [Candidatus Omnitrophota bacterium]
MGYTIAVAGKGGTGKTTLASLLVRLIKEDKKGGILAVDADPNSNLAESLGVVISRSVGSIIDELAANPAKIPSGVPKERAVEYEIQTAVYEGDGFDILSMGRPEGPGCYCYANNVLRNIVSKLVNDYSYVIIDNEAGFEHLSRRTSRFADVLLVVSDPTPAGLRAAERISVLAKELKIGSGRNLLVLNRCKAERGGQGVSVRGLDYIGCIPDDPEITDISVKGASLLGISPGALSLNTLRRIGDKIWQRD